MRKIVSILLIFSLLAWSTPAVYVSDVFAQEVPSQTESPSQPDSPNQPDNPDQPESPSQPTNPGGTGGSDGESEVPSETSPAEEIPGETETTEHSSSEPAPASTTDTGSISQTDGNFGDTAITTGDADAFGVLDNSVNTNVAGGGISGEGATVVNEGNNSGSQNSASVTDSASSTTSQNNDASVVNTATIYAISGDNEVRNNMGGDVLISAGDANASATVVNQVNTNLAGTEVVEFNVVDDHVGDLVLDFDNPCSSGGCVAGTPVYLANIGNNSNTTNTVSLDSETSTETFQNNDALVENNIALTADSGYNMASDNMNGDVIVETGDANVSANVTNFVNNNIAGSVLFGVVNIFGDLIGDIILPEYQTTQPVGSEVANSGNGANSDNFSSVDQSIQDSYTQTNNLALENSINGSANTGENDVRDNIGGDNSITTGDVNAVAQILNIANNNIIGGDWWVVLVNEAGNWVGRIIGGDSGVNYAGSGGTEFIVNPDGTISAYNTGNNSGSQNTTETTQTSQNTIEQTNNASIANNLMLTANTGGNTVKDNANGNASIATGDANIVASVVNFVNNNIVGGRVYITVVNVFGSWLGDFVGPGQEQAETEVVENDLTVDRPIGGITTEPESDDGEVDHEEEVVESIVSQLPKIVKKPASNVVQIHNLAAGSELLSSNSVVEEVSASNSLVAGDVSESTKRKIRINLAWLFVVIPALVVPTLIKRRFFDKALPAKNGVKN